jgi:hypothetical protein
LAVRTDAVLAVLSAIRPESSEFASELGQRGDAAYLRMTKSSEPTRWAVVWSPGDRWFSLDVDGGFSLNYFEEETPDADARRILATYVDLAVQYLRDEPAPHRKGFLRLSAIKITTAEGDTFLHRSLSSYLRRPLRSRRRR